MTQWWTAARLAIGGAALGVPLGTFVGGGLGAAYGALLGDPGVGLDVALIGAAVLGLAGAVYGIALGRRDSAGELTVLTADPKTGSRELYPLIPDRQNATLVG